MMRAGIAAIIAAVVALAAASTSGGQSAGRPAADPNAIKLKSRTFTPSPGVEQAAIAQTAGRAGRVHFLLQLRATPNASTRRAYRAAGIDLVTALGGTAFVAAAATDDIDRARGRSDLRWAGPIRATDKVAATLARGAATPSWARAADGRVALTVQVHSDLDIADAARVARANGGEIIDRVPLVPSVTALFERAAVERLAREDEVVYVAPVEPPLGEHNDGAVGAIGAGPLAAAPYGLTGAGATIMVYDSGIADAGHSDFAGRITQTDSDSAVPTRSHSTHVAGSALGSGANSDGNDSAGNPNGGSANQWAGVAPGASLATFGSFGPNQSADALYTDTGDLNADVTSAINGSGGIDLVTMSLGNNTGANGFPCSQLGDYSNTAILLDEIVTGSIGGRELIYVESAGNERNQICALPANNANAPYQTISSPAPAKNTIVVGAVNSDDDSMTNFSSWGPVDDGRLRPDVVAPGCQAAGDEGLTSTDFVDANSNGALDSGEAQNAYSVRCGTSMAAPAAAGAVALIVQQWRALHGAGSRPLPHTVKALLAHTATDLGPAGPDYQNGFGLINAQAAVDVVRADATAPVIHVDEIDPPLIFVKDVDTWFFESDGSSAPRATLAWSDPPASPLAAAQLVNDLDLRLRAPSGAIYQPRVLDPANPADAATTGDDELNVVELAVAGAAEAGTWRAIVRGDSVPDGPQAYTLITSGAAAAGAPPAADAGGPYDTVEGTDVVLDGGDSSDPDGEALTYAWDLDDDGDYDDSTSATPTFSRVGRDGVFTVGLQVTDESGDTATATATVTVANAAPSLSASSNAPKPEGALVTVSGTVTDAGWLDPLTATIDWGDGGGATSVGGTLESSRPDATLTLASTHRYADNGTYPVEVCGRDDDAASDCDTLSVTITNVDPTVTTDGSQDLAIDEGDALHLLANFSDPGWADTYAAQVDWGTGLPGAVEAGDVAITDHGPLLDRGTVTGSHDYGDNGSFAVRTTVTDDDGGSGSAMFGLTVDNVDPTATIDDGDAIDVNGQAVFLASAGETVPFSARSTDPGSDDLALSWDWDATTAPVDETVMSLVAPPAFDPFPSPSVSPRDVGDVTSHVFDGACLYEIEFSARDDDSGAGSDDAVVLITGNALDNRSAGYWKSQMAAGKGAKDFTNAELECMLKIVGYVSRVFDEVRNASTLAAAAAVLGGSAKDPSKALDQQLLALWLNFANGATDWDQLVDTDADGVPDTPLSEVLVETEDLRLSPAATRTQLLAQAKLLERINLRDK
jgi:hypothetical protein